MSLDKCNGQWLYWWNAQLDVVFYTLNPYTMQHLIKYSYYLLFTGVLSITGVIAMYTQAAVIQTDTRIKNLADQVTVQVNAAEDEGGSGVIIAKQGDIYTVLTANHVVRDTDRSYRVKINKDENYPVEEVNRLQTDANYPDLAIVKFRSPKNYTVATLANIPQITVPSMIFVCGFPAFEDPTNRTAEFSRGDVSSFNPARSQGYAIHYTAPTWKGMSGGPVFDVSGRVVGIHGQGGDTNVGMVKTTTSSKSDSSEDNLIKTGFNSAIPITTFLEQLPKIALKKADLQLDNSVIETPEAISIDPYSQGLVKYEAGDRQGAVIAYNQALKANSENADAYFQRGLIQHEMGDLKGAIADYTHAIKINPKYANAYYNRAIIRAEIGDSDGAIADYSQVINLEPGPASALNNRGRLLSFSGQQQEAILDFNQALKFEPKRPNTYLNRGLAHYRLKDFEGAIADYTLAITYKPDYAKAYGNRGAAYAKLRNREAAIKDFQQAANLFLEQELIDDYEKALIQLEKAKREL
ncbi:tetratricopeptide repeat-containing serine protease family protein [Nostoc sp. NMS9]|uniref:tetratricopeptide repeat-containing S1 family peptidase n=1 Tax=Nostoc sp. NMS9 TaxID=2815393 RepID=UPI0025F8678C|nr:tetratricopeptide repeat-containing serine protease family protein [Nostoc sp. NMS9]MBN3940278.1 serine protease [Nostoc sp. NMS9]